MNFILAMMGSTTWGISREKCNSVDLRQKGQSFFDMPVFNQGSSDYCWAFAGTQMVSALVRNTSQKNFGITKGFIALSPTVTMNNAIAGGLQCFTPCSLVQSVLQSRKGCAVEAVTFHDGKNQFHPDTGLLALRITEKNPPQDTARRQRALRELLDYKGSKNQLSFAFLYNATMAPTCLDLENRRSPFQGNAQINKLIDQAGKDPVSCTEYRAPIFQKVIESDSRFECPNINSAQVINSNDLVLRINQAFDSKVKFPVAIDYCYSFLFDGDPAPRGQLCQKKDGPPVSDHKSVLVARRFNEETQKCEYLLRNSFGNDCNQLHSNFKKGCEDEKKKFNAADVWVASELLEKVVHGVSVLSK